MDFRKVIEFSSGSYVVTLPKAWIHANKIQKGDSMAMEEVKDHLVLFPNNKERTKTDSYISISVEHKLLEQLQIEIITAYLNNCSIIEITSKKFDDTALDVKSILRNLSGMEIIEQSASKIVAKDILDISSISVQTIIRRMDTLTKSMMDDTAAVFAGTGSEKNIEERDVDVNRSYHLGCRVIKNAFDDSMVMRKLQMTPWQLMNSRMILLRIEEIADRQKRICRLISQAKFQGNVLKELRDLMESLRQRYNGAMKAYYTNDAALALSIEMGTKAYVEKLNKLMLRTISGKKQHKKEEDLLASLSIIDYTKSCFAFTRYIARIVMSTE